MTVIFKWVESEMLAALDSCRRDEATPIIERHFPQGTRILESGCGAGRWVRFLQDRGRKMIGLEYSHETVEMVKRHWPDLDIVEGDCERSPFPDGSFDGALSFGVVEHWMEGPQRPLLELLRVLRPGAKAYISVPCFNSIRRLKRALLWDEVTQAPRALAVRILRGTPKPLSRVDRRYLFPVFPAWGEFFEYRMSTFDFRAEVERAGFEGVTICCAFVPEATELTPTEVRRRLRQLLPPYMLPSRWQVLPTLPKTGNGKIGRRELRELFLS